MILAIALLLVLHGWMFYLRHIHFYRKPTNVEHVRSQEIRSPVEGHLMYIRECVDGGWMIKENRRIAAPHLSSNRVYHQIGIYMSPMCNHHVFSPTTGEVVSIRYEGDNLLPMLDNWDMLWPLDWSKDWLLRKLNGFINKNRRLIYHFDNGIVIAIIFDKYVAKYTYINKYVGGRLLLGFIGRGSQVDVFIPKNMIKSIEPQVLIPTSEKISYNALLATELNRKIPWNEI